MTRLGDAALAAAAAELRDRVASAHPLGERGPECVLRLPPRRRPLPEDLRAVRVHVRDPATIDPAELRGMRRVARRLGRRA